MLSEPNSVSSGGQTVASHRLVPGSVPSGSCEIRGEVMTLKQVFRDCSVYPPYHHSAIFRTHVSKFLEVCNSSTLSRPRYVSLGLYLCPGAWLVALFNKAFTTRMFLADLCVFCVCLFRK
jgi:hypothetical protein